MDKTLVCVTRKHNNYTVMGFEKNELSVLSEVIRNPEPHEKEEVLSSLNRQAIELAKEKNGLAIPLETCKDCHVPYAELIRVKDWVWLMAHDKENWEFWLDTNVPGKPEGFPWGDLCWSCLEKRCQAVMEGFQLEWEHFCSTPPSWEKSNAIQKERFDKWKKRNKVAKEC